MPIKIFFCYARKDEALLRELQQGHLKSLERRGLIDVWYDRDIDAGKEWEQEIKLHLNAADIILLLISPDFMASDYCYSIEMKQAIERHKRGEACIIPIVLRPVHWQEELLDILQALPTDAKPVTSWTNRDEALFDVASGIRKVVKEQWLKKGKALQKIRRYQDALEAYEQAIRTGTPSKEEQALRAEIEQLLKAEEERARKAKEERLRRAKEELTQRAEIERLQRAEEERARKAEEERLRKVETTVSPRELPLLLQASAAPHLSTNIIESEVKYLDDVSEGVIEKAETSLVPIGLSIDGKKVLERVKQGQALPSWQVHTDPSVLISFIFPGVVGAIFAGLFIGLLTGAVIVVASFLHLLWQSWLLPSVLIVWGLLTILLTILLITGNGFFFGNRLVIMPEGFVYGYTSGNPILSFYYEALREIIIQNNKVTLVLYSGEQKTESLYASKVALQSLQNTFLRSKLKKDHNKD